MSDLKWQNLAQLQRSKSDCEAYIRDLESKLAGQKERLKWIDRYIYERTPVELSISEIEARLGHKVIIKPGGE